MILSKTVTFGFALLLGVTASAGELQGNGLFSQMGSMLDGMSDALQQQAEEMVKEGLTPESQLTKVTKLLPPISSSGISQINLNNPIFPSSDRVRVIEGNGNQIQISVTSAADPANSAWAQKISNQVGLSVANGSISLGNNITGSGLCASASLNGALSIKGSCITDVVISVPKGSNIAVLNSDKKAIYGTVHWNSSAAVADAIGSESFDSGKMKILGGFVSDVQASGKKLAADSVMAIVKKFDFESSKLAAFKALAPLLASNEALKAAGEIDDTFDFSSSKKEAMNALIRKD
jgi:hypothetical protein